MEERKHIKWVVAAAIVGFLAFGGVSFAAAQGDSPRPQVPAPTTTVDEGTTPPDRGDENCPDHGSGPRGSEPGDQTPSPAPAAASSV